MPTLSSRAGLATLYLLLSAALSSPAQAPTKDVLLFKDGDRISGQLLRIENGEAVFRSTKTGEDHISFDEVLDLKCSKRFAVLRKGLRVNQRNAIIGRIELRGDDLILTPATGPTLTLKATDIAYALDDEVFEREVAGRTTFLEGLSVNGSIGGSVVRSTQESTALKTSLTLTRTIPGVDYLPRRNRTELTLTDSYDRITTQDTLGDPSTVSESHIFHAGLERNEYIHVRFFVLGNYTFDRNYSQGLLGQNLFGVGLGLTALKDNNEELDITVDIHRESEDFNDNTDDVILYGQKFAFSYERSLPRGLRFEGNANYLAADNHPHDYSANATGTLTVPLFWRLRLGFTTTDNYLNNAQQGSKRNTLSFSTGISYSK